MGIHKASFVLAGALCLGAGAGVAYLAIRPATPPEQIETLGVEQSEAVVSDQPVVETPVLSPEAPAASRRTVPAPAPVVRRQTARTATAAPPEPPAASVATGPPPGTLTPPALGPISVEPEAAPVPEAVVPPAPRFVDLEIVSDSVLGLQIESSLSSERARVEDHVVARVTRDVRVGDRVAIPAGSRAEGEVTLVERGGRLKDRARLGVRFTSVVLADGTRVPIATETIYREGDAPGNESAAKIGGGAIGGAIIGGIFGGAKGAIIGGSAGAGAGTAAVLAGGRNAATLPSGTPVTVRITEPAVVTVADNE